MRTRLACGIAAILLVAGSVIAFATLQSAHGPYPGATGAAAIGGKPEEFNCTLCHDGNSLNTPGGGVEILNLPVVYTPGQVYPLTVRLHSNATVTSPARKWGFEITAVQKSDGTGVGTFVLPDPDTLQVVMGEGVFASRAYAEHTFLGTRTGLAGPVEWTLSWQAPAIASGTVYFFCAGNAADGTFDLGNDFTYTTSDSMIPIGTVDAPTSAAIRTTLALPHPNPAPGSVALGYTLATDGRVDLSIFDVQGRRVNRLVSGWREAGSGNVQWDGHRDDGVIVPNGTYFARLSISGKAEILTRKIVLGR